MEAFFINYSNAGPCAVGRRPSVGRGPRRTTGVADRLIGRLQAALPLTEHARRLSCVCQLWRRFGHFGTMLINRRFEGGWSREPQCRWSSRRQICRPGSARQSRSVTTSRRRSLLHDPGGCATLAAAAAMKNSGVRCRGGFEKSLYIPDRRSGFVQSRTRCKPIAARVAMQQDCGLQLRVFGDRFQILQAGHTCAVTSRSANPSCTPRTKARCQHLP